MIESVVDFDEVVVLIILVAVFLIDIEACRREEVIQYVYDRFGRDRAAQVANVITYRTRDVSDR